MSLIIWIVLGAIVGWAVSNFMKPAQEEVDVASISIGVIGAVIGGWFNTVGATAFTFSSLITAVIGAIILTLVAMFFKRKK